VCLGSAAVSPAAFGVPPNALQMRHSPREDLGVRRELANPVVGVA
jgi:hypothetical protein